MRRLLMAQGVYYGLTGLWPIVNMRTFERVTGPKTDRWLVKTVGGVIAAIAATLLTAATAPRPENLAVVLAVATAAALAAADLSYGLRRIISAVYVLDGLVELGLIAAYALLLRAP